MVQQEIFSEEFAAELDREVKNIIDTRYQYAKQLLTENRDLLEAIAKELLEKDQFYAELYNSQFEK